MKKVHDATPPAVAVDPDLPEEVDFSAGVRGRHWPTDPAEALVKALRRLKVVQHTAGRLYDENARLRVLLAWEAGLLSEAEAAAQLGVTHTALRVLRAEALRAPRGTTPAHSP